MIDERGGEEEVEVDDDVDDVDNVDDVDDERTCLCLLLPLLLLRWCLRICKCIPAVGSIMAE